MIIPGTLVPATQYKSQLESLLHTSNTHRFFGAQPISFDSSHLQLLKSTSFFCSEKADGIRVLFYTVTVFNSQNKPSALTFLIDRKNDYYQLPLGLPHPTEPRFLQHTCLDGELVHDVRDGKQVLYFLAFDCLLYEGASLCDKPYTKRLGKLRQCVLDPYLKREYQDQRYRESLPFRIRLKRLHLSYHLPKVFNEISQNKHKSDGIIFTATEAPYTFGTCSTM
jgi:mRNA guanylyltransferase